MRSNSTLVGFIKYCPEITKQNSFCFDNSQYWIEKIQLLLLSKSIQFDFDNIPQFLLDRKCFKYMILITNYLK